MHLLFICSAVTLKYFSSVHTNSNQTEENSEVSFILKPEEKKIKEKGENSKKTQEIATWENTENEKDNIQYHKEQHRTIYTLRAD